jgi:hypothetical protein
MNTYITHICGVIVYRCDPYMDREKANIPDMGGKYIPREEAELLLE